MKKVIIKYNPFKVKTEITVDGKQPKSDSSLRVDNYRLQEWVDQLPQRLIDEYRDRNFEIEFIGTENDYNDVVASLEAYGNSINAKCKLSATPGIAEVEAEIDKIFAEIRGKEDVPELRSPEILQAFEKAKNSQFEINVVATMSSGKSTLINALLGQQLMPARNEATTATIVKIVDSPSDHYSAIGYDTSGNIVQKVANITLESMDALNDDERVSAIEIKGKIPFVHSTGMKLVLVDTPGPNNSRDKRHEDMTYGMIADSDKSLVLYVMNGTQPGTNDEKAFLDYICEQMAKGGKQSRERFIFAVNKMDIYKPSSKYDGPGCIKRALDDAKEGLEQRGISNPNLFPVASLPALQLRDTEDDEEDVPELDAFKKRSAKYEEMRFENYYSYSNLPQSVQKTISSLLEEYKGSDNIDTEIHTGILSIEQAISLYVNKYARIQKVVDLVQSFNVKLEEMATIASLEDEIAKDKKKAEELERQIAVINKNIKAASDAKTLSQEIDKIDLRPNVETEVKAYLGKVRNQISKLMSGDTEKMEISKAKAQCASLEKQVRAISAQIKVEIEKILNTAYKTTLAKILEEYKNHLSSLNMGLEAGSLAFNPMTLVSASLGNLNKIVEDNTYEVDEGDYVTKTKKVEGGTVRKVASFLTFGWVNDYTTETVTEWESDWQQYMDMKKVSHEYLEPIQRHLIETQQKTIDYIVKETERLKEVLKQELVKIDKIYNEKLKALAQSKDMSKAKTEDIARNQTKLKWLKGIQQRVKNIIEF